MPNKCCVPMCRGNYKDGPKVSVYQFPLEASLKAKWLQAIQREDFTPTKHTIVCEQHFSPDDFMFFKESPDDHSGKTIRVSLRRKRLAPGAVPSIFADQPTLRPSLRTPESHDSNEGSENTTLSSQTNRRRGIHCSASHCKNSSDRNPEKLFFSVPPNKEMRLVWLGAMIRESCTLKNGLLYCCQDHFNLEEDLSNYWQFRLMGNVKARLRADAVPRIFPQGEPQGDSRSHSDVVVKLIPKKKGVRKTWKKVPTPDSAEDTASCDDQSTSSSSELLEPEVIIKEGVIAKRVVIKKEMTDDGVQTPQGMLATLLVSEHLPDDRRPDDDQRLKVLTASPSVHYLNPSDIPQRAPQRHDVGKSGERRPVVSIPQVSVAPMRVAKRRLEEEPRSDDARPRDHHDIFGQYIAAKLRKLEPRTCAIASKAISDIIFDAEMGDMAVVPVGKS